MNDDFAALRSKARETRNRITKLARQEYQQTIQQIAELKRESRAKRPLREQKVAQAIEEIIPENQEFTRADILKALQDAAPERRWSTETVKREPRAIQNGSTFRYACTFAGTPD